MLVCDASVCSNVGFWAYVLLCATVPMTYVFYRSKDFIKKVYKLLRRKKNG